jgi:hypothetical protein
VDVEWQAMERAWPSVGGSGGVAPLGDAVGFLKETGGLARGHEWDIVRIGRTLRWAVKSWVEWEVGVERDARGKGGDKKAKAKDDKEERQRLREATERVLEEIAGVLKDLLQEVDERGDDDYEYAGGGAGYAGANPSGVAGSQMEEDESVAIGETLFQLAGWFKGLRWVLRFDFLGWPF